MNHTSLRKRLQYIDGVRGLLALWVAMLHTLEVFGAGMGFLGVASQDMLKDDVFGHAVRFVQINFLRLPFPVEAFIVISGYSLMLVVARRGDGQPNGGLQGYFFRRVKRIWPPYYGAVGLSVLAVLLVPGMGHATGGYWDLAVPALNMPVIGSHLLFLHNWQPDLIFKLNPPMWTIAVEEQIYVLFPIILLPVWRRYGMFAMWGMSAAVGVGLMALNRQFFGSAHSWFLMLFGFGALAACVNFRDGKWEIWIRRHVPWNVVRWIAFPMAILLWKLNSLPVPLRDGAFAVGVIAVLIPATERWKNNDEERGLLGVMSSYPLALLGSFSYSLYLMHAPILTALSKLVLALGITGNMAYVVMMLVALPATVLICYGFHRVFERPFLGASALPHRTPSEVRHLIRPAAAAPTESGARA